MSEPARETATLAGGCFWCLEAVFEQLEGVESVVSGYAGGRRPDPTYEQVCSGATGHAESPIVTQVAPLTAFYPAEGYHQGYYRNNPDQPYCRAMVAPKVAKLRQKYAARLKGAATPS